MKTILLLLVTSCWAMAQQDVVFQATLEYDPISQIEIDGNNMFLITIDTHDSDQIQIIMTASGEYAHAYNLQHIYEEGILSIGLNPTLNFEEPQDKLAAHKVYAISLELIIPKNLRVLLDSDIAAVEMRGDYGYTSINTRNLFVGNNLSGNFNINAINSIDITTDYAQVDAYSRNGIVTNSVLSGPNYFRLQSLNGNISITQE